MSVYIPSNHERLAAIANYSERRFVNERHVMQMLNGRSKGEFDALIEGIIQGGAFMFGGSLLAAIDLDSDDDNVLHFHRHFIGRRVGNDVRKNTDEPTIDVLRQREIFYSFGVTRNDGG